MRQYKLSQSKVKHLLESETFNGYYEGVLLNPQYALDKNGKMVFKMDFESDVIKESLSEKISSVKDYEYGRNKDNEPESDEEEDE